jgi:hypothetical protein
VRLGCVESIVLVLVRPGREGPSKTMVKLILRPSPSDSLARVMWALLNRGTTWEEAIASGSEDVLRAARPYVCGHV